MRLALALLVLVAAAAPRAQTAGAPLDIQPADAFPDASEQAEGARPDAAALGALLRGELSERATASLLTMAPGREVYSRFGHSAIRIQDPERGLDRAYNFGTFDFEQPGFVLRFMRGQLDYILDTAPTAYEFDKYAFLERPVVEQRLVLRPGTVQALYDLLEENARPENRAYRYDFVRDNCSTRLLDALDAALVQTGQPAVALADAPDATFRELLAPYIDGAPLLELGIDLGLARPVDDVATPRQRTFLPDELAAAFDRATVAGRPLVAMRDTVLAVPGYVPPRPGPEWPLHVALAVLAAAGALTALRHTRRPGERERPARIFDVLLFSVVGVAGLILFLLWTATDHTVTRPNWNLAWAWPTHLAAAVALARAQERVGTGPRVYLAATAVLTGALALGWTVVPQTLPPAALPLALALALRAADRTVWPAFRPPVPRATR